MKQYALQPEFKYIHYLHKLNILQTITKVQKEKILPLQQLLGFRFITTGQTGSPHRSDRCFPAYSNHWSDRSTERSDRSNQN